MRHGEITPEMFKDITFRRRNIPGLSVSKYRIYTDQNNFVMVEAENAQGALEASGVINPLRVLHDSIYLDSIITLDDTEPQQTEAKKAEEEGAENTVVAVEETPIKPATASEMPEVTANNPDVVVAETPLTSEDVNKLLNN